MIQQVSAAINDHLIRILFSAITENGGARMNSACYREFQNFRCGIDGALPALSVRHIRQYW